MTGHRHADARFDLSAVAAIDYDDEREREQYATERGRYLERTVGLDKRRGTALGYSELGYSTSGIAKCVDANEGTVLEWLNSIADEYDPRALEARPQSNPVRDLE